MSTENFDQFVNRILTTGPTEKDWEFLAKNSIWNQLKNSLWDDISATPSTCKTPDDANTCPKCQKIEIYRKL